MEDKNIGKAPSLPDEARRDALSDEALETAAGDCKPTPKYPPKGLA